MNILAELYEHPRNGHDDIFLAAFVSSDRTYPIFITKVAKIDQHKYRAECIGYKWGYAEGVDVIRTSWYNDEMLQRETAYRLYTLEQINQVRWQPSHLTVTLPASIAGKLRLTPLKAYGVEIDYEDLPSEYAVVMAISKDHVREMLLAVNPKQNRRYISISELNLTQPNIHWLTY